VTQSGTIGERDPARRSVAGLPARRVLADDVAASIARELVLPDAVAVGALLPSESELAKRYGVSRATVRASLRSLRDAGMIGVRQGIGAVVLARPDATRFGLDRLCSLETFARESGRVLASHEVEIEELVADQDLAASLGIAVGEPVTAVRRLIVEQGSRVAWVEDYVPADVLDPEQLRREFDGSVLDVLLMHGAVDHAECEIEPVAFPRQVAVRLGVPPRTVGLRLVEVMRTPQGRGLSRCVGWYRHREAFGRICVGRRRRVGD
jgi:GntR family transcriptional regulator